MGELWEWITPAGDAFTLGGDDDAPHGCYVLDGVRGRGAPPARAYRRDTPLRSGSLLTAVDYGLRTVDVPVMFRAATLIGLEQLLRDWRRRLDPRAGDGYLRWTAHDGRITRLRCRCMAGLDLDENDRTRGPGWQTATLVFEADAPWFEDADEQSIAWSNTSAGDLWLPEAIPFSVTSSSVYVDATIDNDGDDDTYPVWSIAGPGSNLALVNLTTGKRLAWTAELGAGQTLTIDTRDERDTARPKTVRLGDGTNRYADLTAWELWPLVRGENLIRVELDAADTATVVGLTYRRRWLGP